MKTSETAEMPGLQERIEKLNAILAEAIAIEASICGEEPAEKQLKEPADVLLEKIEAGIELALTKASHIVSQLNRIQGRL